VIAAGWFFGLLMAWFWGERLRDGWHGMPTVADIATPEWDRIPAPAPRLSVIVPARNEGDAVVRGLASLQKL
jgi:hypothetical protein